MCIPIIVVYGYRTSLEPLGWMARMCGRCRRVQAFECFDQLQSNHVYYIYTKEKSIGHVLICDFCETSTGLKPKSRDVKELVVTRTWKRTDGLQALVDKTNPQLGQVPVTDKPTREELFALLESVNERTNPFKIESGGGYLLGAVLGGLGLMIVSLLLYAVGVSLGLDAFGTGFLGLFVGGFGGAIVGMVKSKFDHAANLAQEILIASMARNSISLQTIQRALKHYPKRLKYAAAGVEQLAAL